MFVIVLQLIKTYFKKKTSIGIDLAKLCKTSFNFQGQVNSYFQCLFFVFIFFPLKQSVDRPSFTASSTFLRFKIGSSSFGGRSIYSASTRYINLES